MATSYPTIQVACRDGSMRDVTVNVCEERGCDAPVIWVKELSGKQGMIWVDRDEVDLATVQPSEKGRLPKFYRLQWGATGDGGELRARLIDLHHAFGTRNVRLLHSVTCVAKQRAKSGRARAVN